MVCPRTPKPVSIRVVVPSTPSLRRAMLSSSSLNASGLKPDESKALSERQPTEPEQKILTAIKEVSEPQYIQFHTLVY